ncbi:hypothetical protein [Pseudomonas fluorescens]|uniref:hypothetical protein n=1 Tax=Pseudomonas fluorescens TaxID=294 RepID=UPI0012419A51|nr:hypothetical protein [Pseudomonas fluorescens]
MISYETNPVPKIALELLHSKDLVVSKILKMINYFYFLTSAVFLLMSCTDPKTQRSIAGVDVYGSLFVFCMVLYIPMMVFSFYYFVKALTRFFKYKNSRDGVLFLASSVVGVVALYSFDHWVFSEIY